MAGLDTAAKRRQGAAWLRGLFGGYGPEPDGFLGSRSDRSEMATEYAHILPPVTNKLRKGLLLNVYGTRFF